MLAPASMDKSAVTPGPSGANEKLPPGLGPGSLLKSYSGDVSFCVRYRVATAKAAAQTVLATRWWGEARSWAWWGSNLVVLSGSLAYTRVRQTEMRAASGGGSRV